MKNHSTGPLRRWIVPLIPVLILVGGSQPDCSGQSSSTSASATLRGTTKIDRTFPVAGVKVVAVPVGKGGSAVGKPLPAVSQKNGEYRIEGLTAGSYDLKAVGSSIKVAIVAGVKIHPGNKNVLDIPVVRADRHTRARARIVDLLGVPIISARVVIYSSDLPRSVCELCMLGEVISDKDGQTDFTDLVSEQSYSFIVTIQDRSSGQNVVNPPGRLIPVDAIQIGGEPIAQVDLQVGPDSAIAKVLPIPGLTPSNAPKEDLAKLGDTGDEEIHKTSTDLKVTDAERNAQRLASQLGELAAVSNAVKGAKAAQETADAAATGVHVNERISALDEYEAQSALAISFRPHSGVLSEDSKAMLDEFALKAFSAGLYVIEVSGQGDGNSSADSDRSLSQRREHAVIRYLVDKHGISLRRIIKSFGHGDSPAMAEKTSRARRAPTRQVTVKLLVNRARP